MSRTLSERFLNKYLAEGLMTENNSYKRKAELERFLALMSMSDDQLRIMNANERLGLDSGRDVRILGRTMSESQYQNSWFYLDSLASEYQDLVKKDLVEKGITINRRKKYKRQLEIEAEIVERMAPFVLKIARAMVYGNGWQIDTPHGYKVLLSLKDSEIQLQDLVQEGLAKIVEKLSDYDPEKGSVNTYFRTVVATQMYDKGRGYMGLLRLPSNIFNEAKAAIRKENRRSAKKVLEEVAREGPSAVPKSLQAIAMYHGLKRRWVSIHGSSGRDASPSDDTFENRYLEDESDHAKVEEVVGNKQLQQKAVTLLKTLTPIEEDIIRQRIWEGKVLTEIGKNYDLGRERIRLIEARALSKLRIKLHSLLK